MTRSHRLLTLCVSAGFAPLLMANQGCESVYQRVGLDGLVETACGSSALSSYLGGPIAAVPDSLMAGTLVRVIRPGDAVTADYNDSRLNISLNTADEIVDIAGG